MIDIWYGAAPQPLTGVQSDRASHLMWSAASLWTSLTRDETIKYLYRNSWESKESYSILLVLEVTQRRLINNSNAAMRPRGIDEECSRVYKAWYSWEVEQPQRCARVDELRPRHCSRGNTTGKSKSSESLGLVLTSGICAIVARRKWNYYYYVPGSKSRIFHLFLKGINIRAIYRSHGYLSQFINN